MNALYCSGNQDIDMKTKSKIWLGVGAFVVAGTGAMGGPLVAETPAIATRALAATRRSRALAPAAWCSRNMPITPRKQAR
jgi:hypothetical protein